MAQRRINGFGVGESTPEQTLAKFGIDGKADVYDLVEASRWKDANQNRYLDTLELEAGAQELKDRVGGAPSQISIDGYRANRAVFYKHKNALIGRLRKPVSNRQLIDAAKPKDDGNKYLSDKELGQAAKDFKQHEQEVSEGRADERIRFDQAPEVAPSGAAKKRDAVFDRVVDKAAAQLRALGHQVVLDGADVARADMMSGRVPTMSYDAGFGQDYRGEVYNRITVTTARGRSFTASLGMLSSDQTYPGTSSKVYDRNIMLLNLDDRALKYTGAGIDLSVRFGPGGNARAPLANLLTKEEEMVQAVVGWFTNIIALNP